VALSNSGKDEKVEGNMMDALKMVLAGLIVFGCTAFAQGGELMSLAEIEKGLEAAPPHLGDNSDREEHYKGLDAWALAPDTIYWDGKAETANAEMLDYYLRRMNKALDEASEISVAAGASVWKLYSSGFMVKTPECVFAIDVVEGPFKNINKSPEDESDFRFKWTEAMRKRFAELADVLFITHWHYDHASFALAKAMIEAGKVVVVPQQLKDHWRRNHFAEKLTTLEADADQELGTLTVRVFDGVQYMRQDEAGNWISVPEYDAQNNVYLIRTTGGITFMHHGDNRGRPFAGWLEAAADDGWKVDMWFIPIHWPKSMIPDVEKIMQPVYVPCHEYEFGHKPTHGVITIMPHYLGPLRRFFEESRAVRLTWGERFEVGASE
jgi:L-ascorbate metabolism protein UlaG (beta-lactamase superfamily)